MTWVSLIAAMNTCPRQSASAGLEGETRLRNFVAVDVGARDQLAARARTHAARDPGAVKPLPAVGNDDRVGLVAPVVPFDLRRHGYRLSSSLAEQPIGVDEVAR